MAETKVKEEEDDLVKKDDLLKEIEDDLLIKDDLLKEDELKIFYLKIETIF